MLGRLHAQQNQHRGVAQAAATKVRDELSQLERKAKRLQEAYLDEVVSLEEFRTTKTSLTTKRASLKERLSAIEASSGKFCPAPRMRGWVEDARSPDVATRFHAPRGEKNSSRF